MNFTFERMSEEHRIPVIDIFNYYIENSFAAFLEQCLRYESYDVFLQMAARYPAFAVQAAEGQTVGFGMLHAYNPLPTFSHTAEVSYFIHPASCGQGIGTALLRRLLDGGKNRGITNVLAHVSALNEASIRFHQKHGFVECGRFKAVCRKNGQFFDTVWMQKML